jgi:hypothetical protein
MSTLADVIAASIPFFQIFYITHHGMVNTAFHIPHMKRHAGCDNWRPGQPTDGTITANPLVSEMMIKVFTYDHATVRWYNTFLTEHSRLQYF